MHGVFFIGLIKVATKMNKFDTIVFKGVFDLSDKSGKEKRNKFATIVFRYQI